RPGCLTLGGRLGERRIELLERAFQAVGLRPGRLKVLVHPLLGLGQASLCRPDRSPKLCDLDLILARWARSRPETAGDRADEVIDAPDPGQPADERLELLGRAARGRGSANTRER